MSIKAYRKLSFVKLEEKVTNLKIELAQVKMDLKSGRDKDYSQVAKKKREIARLMTVMTDKLFMASVDGNDEAPEEVIEEEAKEVKKTKKVTKLKDKSKDEKED